MAVSLEIVENLEVDEPERQDFACSACGYGIVVRDELPACPMCRSESWELMRSRFDS